MANVNWIQFLAPTALDTDPFTVYGPGHWLNVTSGFNAPWLAKVQSQGQATQTVVTTGVHPLLARPEEFVANG